MRNLILEKYTTHADFSPERIASALEVITNETGFLPKKEIHRRLLFQPQKTWRVCIAGTYAGKPAVLRIENMHLEVDEEYIRRSFRAQGTEGKVRPPQTYLSAPFDPAIGFAWSIDEMVNAPPLFQIEADPKRAARRFAAFYRKLRETVTKPFWTEGAGPAAPFCVEQFKTWKYLAEQRNPEAITRNREVLIRLGKAVRDGMAERNLRFMHPHMAPQDVRALEDGTYVVFANHAWSWRQPGHDVAFPIWVQWMSLPPQRRMLSEMVHVTESWRSIIRRWLPDLVTARDVRVMLLSRLYGSLMLDLPARRAHESRDAAEAHERAFLHEADRLLVEY